MKSRNIIVLLMSSVLLIGNAAFAASSDDGKHSQALICAISTFFECNFENGCQIKTAEELNAPRFLKIMVDEKKIVPIGKTPDDTHISKIINLARIDGMLILQGVEDGDADKCDGVGWTISISEDTGRLSITASGHEVGFTGLGACSTY